jgi:hypothetical protein
MTKNLYNVGTLPEYKLMIIYKCWHTCQAAKRATLVGIFDNTTYGEFRFWFWLEWFSIINNLIIITY